MTDWRTTLLSAEATIETAIHALNKSASKTVDEEIIRMVNQILERDLPQARHGLGLKRGDTEIPDTTRYPAQYVQSSNEKNYREEGFLGSLQ